MKFIKNISSRIGEGFGIVGACILTPILIAFGLAVSFYMSALYVKIAFIVYDWLNELFDYLMDWIF